MFLNVLYIFLLNFFGIFFNFNNDFIWLKLIMIVVVDIKLFIIGREIK